MSDTGDRADALLRELGYAEWRPGQREAVVAALEGRDSLIVMPTGGGKSLCYQLPGLASTDLTIVVSPLIALMRDQWQRLTARGQPVAMISSGMDDGAVREALGQVRGEARIVYCAPERFASNLFLDALAERRIDLIAVDEAHCVSEWGHDFRPDYLRLPQIAERLGRPTVMACTATATKPVAAEIASRFGMRDPLQVRSGFDRPNLSFDVVSLEGKGSKARRQALLEAGLADPANRPAIVYCGTRRDTDEVAGTLRATGLRVLPYHAGMEAEERSSVQHRFMSGEAEVIVATNAFGMGVDKADVRSVWHMAIPTSVEAYYQEAGRAGRDGLPARAVLLAMKADLGRLVRFNQQRAGDPELAIAHERGWRAYHAIKSFIYSDRCRRRSLLDHFSDRTAGAPLERCCDVCDQRDWLPDPQTIAVRPRRGASSPAGPVAAGDPPPPAVAKASSGVGPPTAPPAGEPAPADAPLFEELKTWRLRAAAGKPAFTVASNRTLSGIAAARPRSRPELLAIHGVGPAFVGKYAEEVLALVARHAGSVAA
ncbi:MAG TPA: ATP-dependent DNA helicase RecQ [Solirubrobacterales bacterium]|jgi:RecQ family ATP-dependent DNA helicase|nr:ATP-dependent DNA helicase RecQ [Solirubrobacterales bacterium]